MSPMWHEDNSVLRPYLDSRYDSCTYSLGERRVRMNKPAEIPESIAIAGVCERDMDLFLLEEMSSNMTFLRWLVEAAGVPAADVSFHDAKRSVTQSNGESDLELAVLRPDGHLVKILIENKIDANFQPRQAERYQERADDYVRNGQVTEAVTMLVAPRRYFGASGSTKGFGSTLSYEDIWEAIAADDSLGLRREYKMKLLSSAINKGRVGYQAEADAPVTDFWGAYWNLACSEAPELQMNDPGLKPSGAGFIYFRPGRLHGLMNICHKLPHGNVDLHLPGWGTRIPELHHLLDGKLDDGMAIAKAAKSGAIRIRVPEVNTADSFPGQRTAVHAGLLAAQTLFMWFEREYESLKTELNLL
jgi:hypothetical protein